MCPFRSTGLAVRNVPDTLPAQATAYLYAVQLCSAAVPVGTAYLRVHAVYCREELYKEVMNRKGTQHLHEIPRRIKKNALLHSDDASRGGRCSAGTDGCSEPPGCPCVCRRAALHARSACLRFAIVGGF